MAYLQLATDNGKHTRTSVSVCMMCKGVSVCAYAQSRHNETLLLVALQACGNSKQGTVGQVNGI